MAAEKMKEILKHFPDLEDGWKEMEEKLKAEPAEMEMLSLKYREMLQRESSKESLVESEFTKAKRAESVLKVMKANEAKQSKFVYPDKLYARTNDNITLDISYAPQTLEAVEYTRTDAFIEKAARFLEYKLYDRVEIRVFGTVIPSLTSKKAFIDEFKKYMKGE